MVRLALSNWSHPCSLNAFADSSEMVTERELLPAIAEM